MHPFSTREPRRSPRGPPGHVHTTRLLAMRVPVGSLLTTKEVDSVSGDGRESKVVPGTVAFETWAQVSDRPIIAWARVADFLLHALSQRYHDRLVLRLAQSPGNVDAPGTRGTSADTTSHEATILRRGLGLMSSYMRQLNAACKVDAAPIRRGLVGRPVRCGQD